MHISLNWIREHCPFETSESPERIGERFSLATAEVEGVECRGEALAQFTAARVEKVEAIEGADKLTRVQVKAGKGPKIQVVCGAPNVREGMVVPYAAPGTVVQGKTLEIMPLRGVESRGMLLSEAELGISDDHSGLLELPADVRPGTPLNEVLPGTLDIVVEVDNKSLTHRPDLWGHYGIAREFSTIYKTPLRPYPSDESVATAPGDSEIVVSIDDGEAASRCPRYCGLQIDGVRVGPSPDWLKHRLLAVGSRPINNIVDITNFVLLDLGQPLHSFDVERLRGGRIRVRMAEPGEKMQLLDGNEIELDPEDVLIADGEGPVALAGVMGGDGSQIHDGTVSIFLESANFSATSVRRSSLRHGRTDSSARFEKSLDPHQARIGILRAAALVLELCPGARVVGELQDVGFTPPEPTEIQVSPAAIAGRLGCDIPAADIRDILEGLGFVVDDADRVWRVTVPSWRSTGDISIVSDLVEEIGRIHGYDNIEPSAPNWPVAAPPVNESRQLERRIKDHLSVHCGLNEVFTYSMVGCAHCERFGMDPNALLALANPITEEQDRLRREIVPIHVEKAAENRRFFEEFGFFEVGRVYQKEADQLDSPDLPRENTRIAGILAFREKREINFYRLRDVVLSMIQSLDLGDVELAPLDAPPPWAHPQVAASLRVGNSPAGAFYRIHPDCLGKFELTGDVLAFDLDFDALLEAPGGKHVYRGVAKYPDVPFDVSVLVPARTPVAEVQKPIREAAGELLQELSVFDVYRGAGLEDDQKSVSLHLVFRSDERTLGAEEVESLQNAVIASLKERGFPLR